MSSAPQLPRPAFERPSPLIPAIGIPPAERDAARPRASSGVDPLGRKSAQRSKPVPRVVPLRSKFRGRVISFAQLLRRALAVFLLGATGCGPGSTRLSAANEPAPSLPERPVMHLGISRSVFRNTNLNDAIATYRVIMQRIAKQVQLAADVAVEVEVFDEPGRFATALRNPAKPIHVSVIMAWDYLQMDLPETIRPQFVVTQHGVPGRHYCLITHRSSGFNRLNDLRGKSLLNFDLGPGTQGWSWLNIILDEAFLPPAAEWFGEISGTAKANATVLPVFFRTRDACLVDEPSFELIGELNPQVSRDLQVVARSEALADVVLCISDTGWLTENFRLETIKALGDLQNSPDGQQLLNLFKIESLVPFEPRFLDASRELMYRQRPSARRPVP